MKNPIRTYFNWYGRNLTDISVEPAGKAIWHFTKFSAKNIGISIAVSAVICGGVAIGQYIHNKLTEKQDY